MIKLNETLSLLTENVLRIYVQQKYFWPRQRNVVMSIYLNEYNGEHRGPSQMRHSIS